MELQAATNMQNGGLPATNKQQSASSNQHADAEEAPKPAKKPVVANKPKPQKTVVATVIEKQLVSPLMVTEKP